MVTFGAHFATSTTLVAPLAFSASAVNALIASGTSCRFSERNRAVTTISSRPGCRSAPLSCALSACGPSSNVATAADKIVRLESRIGFLPLSFCDADRQLTWAVRYRVFADDSLGSGIVHRVDKATRERGACCANDVSAGRPVAAKYRGKSIPWRFGEGAARQHDGVTTLGRIAPSLLSTSLRLLA